MSNIRDFQKKKTSDQPILGDFETILYFPKIKNTIMDRDLYLKMVDQIKEFTLKIEDDLPTLAINNKYTYIYLSLIRIEELIRAIFNNFIFISDDLKIPSPPTTLLFKDKTEKRIFKEEDLNSWIRILNKNIFLFIDVNHIDTLKRNRHELIEKYIHIVTIPNTDKIHKHPVAGFKGVKAIVNIPQFTVLGSYAGLLSFSREKDSFLEYAWGFKTSYKNKNKEKIFLYIKNNDEGRKYKITITKGITSINLLPEDLRKQVFTIVIDAKQKGNIFRFINDYRGVPKKYNPEGTHNCATVPIWNFKLERPEFIVFTTRNIESGRELFFDYGDDYWLGWTIEILKDKKKNEKKFNSSQKKINDTTEWLSEGMNIINDPIL